MELLPYGQPRYCIPESENEPQTAGITMEGLLGVLSRSMRRWSLFAALFIGAKMDGPTDGSGTGRWSRIAPVLSWTEMRQSVPRVAHYLDNNPSGIIVYVVNLARPMQSSQ